MKKMVYMGKKRPKKTNNLGVKLEWIPFRAMDVDDLVANDLIKKAGDIFREIKDKKIIVDATKKEEVKVEKPNKKVKKGGKR